VDRQRQRRLGDQLLVGYGPAVLPHDPLDDLGLAGYRGDADLKPLILDRRVARALRGRGVFGPKTGNTNWPSHLYRTYLEYCREQNPKDPAAVEKSLFNEGKG